MRTLLPLAFIIGAPLASQTAAVVVPSGYENAAGEHIWSLPGGQISERQQIVIDGSLFQSVVGKSLVAIQLRRSTSPVPEPAGDVGLTATVSLAGSHPNNLSQSFFANEGNTPTVVFQGLLALPATPPSTAAPNPWTAPWIAEIPLATPLTYGGGSLIIDLVGNVSQVGGQGPSLWWTQDAAAAPQLGSVAEIGIGCSTFGPLANDVDAERLIAGTTALFRYRGASLSLAAFIMGATSSPQAVDLSLFGAANGCFLHLVPPVSSTFTVVGAAPSANHPQTGGFAYIALPLPLGPATLGAQLAHQWVGFDQGSLTTTRALRWTIAQSPSSLGVGVVRATFDGVNLPATGEVRTDVVPIVRLVFQ